MHKLSCFPFVFSLSCRRVSEQLHGYLAAGQALPIMPRKFRIPTMHSHGTSQVLRERNPSEPPQKGSQFVCVLMIFAVLHIKVFRCIGTCRRSMGIPVPGYFRSYFPFNLSGCQDSLKIWHFIKAAGLLFSVFEPTSVKRTDEH